MNRPQSELSTQRLESRDDNIVLLDFCPWCASHRGEWSARWRTCLRCGCSWRYARSFDAGAREGGGVSKRSRGRPPRQRRPRIGREAAEAGVRQKFILWPVDRTASPDHWMAVGRLEGWGKCDNCGLLHPYQLAMQMAIPAGRQEPHGTMVDTPAEVAEVLAEWWANIDPDDQFLISAHPVSVIDSYVGGRHPEDACIVDRAGAITFLLAPFPEARP